MILLTSANSRTQREVIAALRGTDEPVRVFGRTLDAGWLVDHGVTDLHRGDLLDRLALDRAFKGVRAVIHLGPGLNSKESVIGQFVIDAAKRAQVEQFVYISVIHPQISQLRNHHAKLLVEDYLIASRLPFTILQPQHYFQNVNLPRVMASRELSLPYSMDRPLAFVDMVDLGVVAAKVVTQAGHRYATYEISSSEHLTGVEIAAMLSRLSGTQIVARQSRPEDVLDYIVQHYAGDAVEADWTIDAAHRLFGYYDRYGITGNGNVLGWLLGRPPTTFAQYIRRGLDELASS